MKKKDTTFDPEKDELPGMPELDAAGRKAHEILTITKRMGDLKTQLKTLNEEKDLKRRELALMLREQGRTDAELHNFTFEVVETRAELTVMLRKRTAPRPVRKEDE